MPPDLKRVKTFLSRALKPHIAAKANFTQWLDALFMDDLGKVLGVNLYIDLRNRSLPIPLLLDVLNRLTANASYVKAARDGFYFCIEAECQHICLCKHPGKVTPLAAGDRYVRVLPLESMINFYLRDAITAAPNAEGEAEVRREFYGKGPRRKLGLVKKTWRGKMNNVWVTSFNTLLGVLAGLPEKKKANVIRDRFGFFGADTGTLVYVAYPPDFTEAYVPTTLDAHSGCYFFVPPPSPPPPAWGLTCSLTPGHTGVEERVHLAFDGLTDEYESEIIGDITEPSSPDPNHLLSVALSRA